MSPTRTAWTAAGSSKFLADTASERATSVLVVVGMLIGAALLIAAAIFVWMLIMYGVSEYGERVGPVIGLGGLIFAIVAYIADLGGWYVTGGIAAVILGLVVTFWDP